MNKKGNIYIKEIAQNTCDCTVTTVVKTCRGLVHTFTTVVNACRGLVYTFTTVVKRSARANSCFHHSGESLSETSLPFSPLVNTEINTILFISLTHKNCYYHGEIFY